MEVDSKDLRPVVGCYGYFVTTFGIPDVVGGFNWLGVGPRWVSVSEYREVDSGR